MRKTSASDNGAYPEFCYFASRKDDIFANFKRHPIYNQILEHVSPQQGLAYLQIILSNDNLNLNPDKWNLFLQNDKIGNPRVVQYNFNDQDIICSPTTLRYLKVASDILKLFNINNIKSVSEIGIGYAGQCRILKNIFRIAQYNLVDLPEVLALAERFLNEANLKTGGGSIRYFDGTHLYNEIETDLLISNYAFSELTRTVQDIYLEKIIFKSKAGYITWNGSAIQPSHNFDGYSLDEFLKIMPNASVLPEQPLTAPGNCIVVWGNN